jgi:four helix bundle protein
MAKIEQFETIDAWKAARELTRRVYEATSTGSFAKDFGLREQAQRATVSTMANIAEGFDSGSNREFIKFLGYAVRSATELQSHLYVALDQGYLGQQELNALFALTVKCKNLTSGFMRYLRSHRRKPRTSDIER